MIESLDDLKRIKPGDFVCLTDQQTIKDLMESKVSNATDGLQLEIEQIQYIHEQNGLCDWYLCPLKGEPEGYPKLHFMVKIVDDAYDLRIYWIPEDFADPRTCGDLVNDGVLWLFQEPASENFKPCDLKYSIEISQPTENGSDLMYHMKGGALFGEYRELPVPQGLKQPQFCSVMEYITEQGHAEDPELLILEIGGLDEECEKVEEGGVVHFFQGGPVNGNDISLIQQ